MRKSLIIIVSILTLFGLISAGGEAGAVVHGTNGRIVFIRAVCRTTTCDHFWWRIVAADPNDANETVLAGPYPDKAFDEELIANWSPDGASVIFTVNQGIWQVKEDGTGLYEVFRPRGIGDGPTFTPDGRHIVFSRCCPTGHAATLWMIDVDGTGLTQLTRDRHAFESTRRIRPADTKSVPVKGVPLCGPGAGPTHKQWRCRRTARSPGTDSGASLKVVATTRP